MKNIKIMSIRIAIDKESCELAGEDSGVNTLVERTFEAFIQN